MKEILLFGIKKPIIGMIHVDALPATPNYNGDVSYIIDKAVKEAMVYCNAGVDAMAIENMHDIPYIKRTVGPEITSIMSIIGYEVKNKTGLPCGIQILAGANKYALAAAYSAGLDFIRAEGFVFAHAADEGLMESDAGELLRYKKAIGAEDILVFTDIKKKHSSHAITSDINIVETAKAAQFFLSDGIIITGSSTGEEADIYEINKVKEATNIPVLIGSGITLDNFDKYYNSADAFIIGSYFKQGGYWKNEVDIDRVEALIKKFK
jgi:uncharacterized protein